MKRKLHLAPCFVFLCAALLSGWRPAHAVKPFMGAGVLYNAASGDVESAGLDSSYFSYVLSLRSEPGPGMSMEFSVDYYPGKGEIGHVIRPFAAVIWGGMINYGAGLTRSYIKHEAGGGEWSSLSYHLQGGVELPAGPDATLHLDAFHSLQKFGDVKDISLKNLAFAARIFFRF